MPCLESTSRRSAAAILERYFETFNHNQFAETAALFSLMGELHAPFEPPVVGREPITAYLHREASRMTAHPSSDRQSERLANDREQIVVQGQVQTTSFKVGVEWRFIITSESEIEAVYVKLLASMKDLLSLRPLAQ
ncbi:MAG: ketosteroid isomerase family protein [Cyanobacteria bacterium P01_A01_bin.114]